MLDSTAIHRSFRIFGKLVKLGQQGLGDASNYRTLISTTIDSIANGSVSDAVAIVAVGIPMSKTTGDVAKTLDAVATNARSYVAAYLQKVVSLDAGLASGVSVAAVGAALVSAMNTAGETVAPSGGGNTTGFRAYFADKFNILLPEAVDADSATCPDSWISVA